MIKLLEDALMLADDLDDGNTGYLIERALDEARSRQFTPSKKVEPRSGARSSRYES